MIALRYGPPPRALRRSEVPVGARVRRRDSGWTGIVTRHVRSRRRSELFLIEVRWDANGHVGRVRPGDPGLEVVS